MKTIDWVDKDGFQQRSILRDADDERNPEEGIILSPPDIRSLDWDEIVRDLHNRLFDTDVFDYQDLMAKQTAVTSAILAVLRKRIVNLYKINR